MWKNRVFSSFCICTHCECGNSMGILTCQYIQIHRYSFLRLRIRQISFHGKYEWQKNALISTFTHTGCPGSKFATSKSFYSEIMLVRPQDGKAKMCLRDIHFCLHLELFVYNRVEIMTKYPNFQSCLRARDAAGRPGS